MDFPRWMMPEWLVRAFNRICGEDVIVQALKCTQCGRFICTGDVSDEEADKLVWSHRKFFHPDEK